MPSKKHLLYCLETEPVVVTRCVVDLVGDGRAVERVEVLSHHRQRLHPAHEKHLAPEPRPGMADVAGDADDDQPTAPGDAADLRDRLPEMPVVLEGGVGENGVEAAVLETAQVVGAAAQDLEVVEAMRAVEVDARLR
jgi:hypothetical protein